MGTVVAFLIVPMRSLGQDGWKIASALMGRHIGGGNLADIYLFCKYMEKLDKKQTIGLFCAFPNFDRTQYANMGRYYVSERKGFSVELLTS